MNKPIKKWKILASKVILDHARLAVVEDQILLPDNTVSTYVKHGPAQTHSVAVIAVDEVGKVLIQREYSHPPNKVMWQLPGGSINPKERPKKAALRELAEESGYSTENCLGIGSYYVHNRLSDKFSNQEFDNINLMAALNIWQHYTARSRTKSQNSGENLNTISLAASMVSNHL